MMTAIECSARSIEDERREKKRLYDIEYRAKNKDKNRAVQNAWRSRNKDHLKSYHRKHELKRYGLTQEAWDAMFAAQGHRCATCHTVSLNGKAKWHTDHCHETGVVRGILCGLCNKALGLLKDNTSTLSNAISYLNKFKQ
jgi:hypothetical protein